MKFKIKQKAFLEYLKMIELSFRSIFILISLSLLTTVLEIFGIGMFYPIFQYINADQNISIIINDSKLWEMVTDFLMFFNLDVSLQLLLSIVFILLLFRQIFSYIRMIYTLMLVQFLEKKLRDKMFEKYLSSRTEYHDRLSIGGFTNVVSVEARSAVIGILKPIDLIVHFIILTVFLYVLFLISWKMTIASILIFLISSSIPKRWIKKSKKAGRSIVDANINLTSFLVNRLKSARLVRLSGTENQEVLEFNKLTEIQRKAVIFGGVLKSRVEVVIEPVVIALSLVFLYMSISVFDMEIALIGLYMIVSMRILPVVKGILGHLEKLKSATGSIETVYNRINEMSSNRETNCGHAIFNDLGNGIKFKSVYDKYPDSSNNAIDNLTFDISTGSTVAIVGHSGSGKSTLIDLIPCLRLPTSGNIYLGGNPANNYRLSSLRNSIAFVPQKPQIFNGTIKEHICLGSNNLTDKEIHKASLMSGAYEFIKDLPDKYDTFVGDETTRLSGGQSQRLDLARVLANKARILIFDEPTSGLDIKTEENFINTLREVRAENIIIIVVTHNIKLASGLDQIIVLNKGRVESTGSHKYVLQNSTWYKKSWELNIR